jgi:MoxR-like ATPase
MSATASEQIDRLIEEHSPLIRRLVDSVGQVVVGQQSMVEGLVISLLTGGHVLLEGVPGLAKTLTVSSLAGAIHAKFSRVQFTPDLLPADLIGTLIYDPREHTFTPRKGPIFANIVLADEINRAPAKVQSALLEAMQERSVTIGETTYRLQEPFLVLATQNPIEQEGTYPLPEAQMDRFMLKLRIEYPSRDDERAIVDRMAASSRPKMTPQASIDLDELRAARDIVDQIYVDGKVKDYAVDLARATRNIAEVDQALGPYVDFGASPRAPINLVLAARARAFLEGRGYVTPGDVKRVAPDVLRHRIIISYEAQADGVTSDDIVTRLLAAVPAP